MRRRQQKFNAASAPLRIETSPGHNERVGANNKWPFIDLPRRNIAGLLCFYSLEINALRWRSNFELEIFAIFNW